MTRVLKPGGKLYLNANGIGWYVFLWNTEHNKTKDYDPRTVVAKTFIDTVAYEKTSLHEVNTQIIIDKAQLIYEMHRIGYTTLDGNEGTIHTSRDGPEPKPLLLGEYGGESAVYEIIGNLKS